MKNINEARPPSCECDEVHEERVASKRGDMPDTETLYELSDFFKIFGDSTRMSILFAIDGTELCVCDIASLLSMTKSAVSHQLKILRQSDLINDHIIPPYRFFADAVCVKKKKLCEF